VESAPEPTGSRRATPLSYFQHSSGHPDLERQRREIDDAIALLKATRERRPRVEGTV
jgi:hypothetical protein